MKMFTLIVFGSLLLGCTKGADNGQPPPPEASLVVEIHPALFDGVSNALATFPAVQTNVLDGRVHFPVVCTKVGRFSSSDTPDQRILELLSLTDSQGRRAQLEIGNLMSSGTEVVTPKLDAGEYTLEVAKTFAADDGASIPVVMARQDWVADSYKRTFWAESRPAVRAVYFFGPDSARDHALLVTMFSENVAIAAESPVSVTKMDKSAVPVSSYTIEGMFIHADLPKDLDLSERLLLSVSANVTGKDSGVPVVSSLFGSKASSGILEIVPNEHLSADNAWIP